MNLRSLVTVTCSLLLAGAGPAAAAPFAFATNAAAGSVSAVDLATDTVAASFGVGTLPSGVAVSPGGDAVYVALTNGAAVAVLDLSGGGVTTFGVGAAPSGLALSPSGDRLYVAETQGDTLAVLDTAAGTVLDSVPVGDQPVAVAADAARIYVANYGGDSLTVLDAATHAPVATLPVGGFPAGVAVDPAGTRVWITSLFDGTVTVVDPAVPSVVATVPVGAATRGVAVSPAGDRVYVADFGGSSVAVLDALTNAVLDTVAVGLNPTDLVVSPGGDRVLVTDVSAGEIAVLDAVTLQLQAGIAAGAGHVAIAGFGDVLPQQAPLEIPALGGAGLAVLALLVAVAAIWALGRRGAFLVVLAAVASLAAASPAPVRAQAVISDTELADADWEIFSEQGPNAAAQAPAGGNPGAYRAMSHTHFDASGPVAVVEVVHRFVGSGGSHDPSSQGAVLGIDASWDRQMSGDPVSQVEERLVVFQGGTAYSSVAQTFSNTTWQAANWIGLTAADFDDGGGSPDLSASGGPLTFGFLRRTEETTGLGGGATHDLDNFQVTLTLEGGGGAPGAFRISQRSYVTGEGETLDVSVERVGGTDGAVGVTLEIDQAAGFDVVPLSWADGDGSTRVHPAVFDGLPAGSPVQLVRLSLAAPSGGATIDPTADRSMVFVVPDDAPAALVALQLLLLALLAELSPWWLLAVGLAAVHLAWGRRKRRRASLDGAGERAGAEVLALLAAVLVLASLPACLPSDEVDSGADAPELLWNDRIRIDGKPLAEVSNECTSDDELCMQLRTDPWVGHYETRDALVMSEVYPELGDDAEVRRLPKSDCFWVPTGQALRASWEAILAVDPCVGFGQTVAGGFPEMDPDVDQAYGAEIYPGPRDCDADGTPDDTLRWLSVCDVQTPYTRQPVQIDLSKVCGLIGEECPACTDGPYWAAIASDPAAASLDCKDPASNPVVPFDALFEDRMTVFDAELVAAPPLAPAEPWQEDHNLCAPGRPDPANDGRVTSWVASETCPIASDGSGLLAVCADRCVFQPDRDATLYVRSAVYGRHRVLSPTLMTVEKGSPRRLVRPMVLDQNDADGDGAPEYSFDWQTPPSEVRNDPGAPDPEEPSLRWEENFTPDLQVSRVRILQIDGRGAETALAPPRLRVFDPVQSRWWECDGVDPGDGSKVFDLLTKSSCLVEDELRSLPATPTYVVSNVTDGTVPLTNPLLWDADWGEVPLKALPPADEVYVELLVENFQCQAPSCNALKISAEEEDLGGLQVGEPHRTVLEVSNVGPEPLRVGTVRTEGVIGYPDARGDFTPTPLFRARAVPYPVELHTDGTLRLGSDFGTSPLIQDTTVQHQPGYSSTLHQNGARVVFQGYGLEATGRVGFESHRVTYTDPLADFTWTPSSLGVRRPFGEVAYLVQPLPFYLDPGESFWVRVTATPRDYGDRRAWLRVYATADSNPSIPVWTQALLVADGIAGPTLWSLPHAISLPSKRLDPQGNVVPVWERNALIGNTGGVDMVRTTIQITGWDFDKFYLASSHPASSVIPPGGDEIFLVGYTPSCATPRAPVPTYGPRQFEAQLRITTDGGEAVFELRGEWCPQLGPSP